MPRQFDVVIERDPEGYYVASVPQLPACHTQAKSLDQVMERIREAIELCLQVEGAPEQDLEFVGIPLLHKILKDCHLTAEELSNLLKDR